MVLIDRRKIIITSVAIIVLGISFGWFLFSQEVIPFAITHTPIEYADMLSYIKVNVSITGEEATLVELNYSDVNQIQHNLELSVPSHLQYLKSQDLPIKSLLSVGNYFRMEHMYLHQKHYHKH